MALRVFVGSCTAVVAGPILAGPTVTPASSAPVWGGESPKPTGPPTSGSTPPSGSVEDFLSKNPTAKERLRKQSQLLETALPLRDQIEGLEENYTGATIDADSETITIYISGTVDKRSEAAAAAARSKSRAKVAFKQALYSRRFLEQAQQKIWTQGERFGIASVSIYEDGHGLEVAAASSSSNAEASLSALTGVPVSVVPGGTFIPFSRWDDSAPWWGGAAVDPNRTHNYCTTGVGVRSKSNSSLKYLAVAGHCFPSGTSAYDPTGTFIGNRNWGGVGRGIDASMIGTNAGSQIYDGAWNDTQGGIGYNKPVSGYENTFNDQWVCISSAYTGTVCDA